MIRESERHALHGGQNFISRISRLSIIEVTAEASGVSGLPVDEVDLATLQAAVTQAPDIRGIPTHYHQRGDLIAIFPRAAYGVAVRIVSQA